jgi:hypothetical protein
VKPEGPGRDLGAFPSCAGLAFAKLAVSALVLAGGFRAVSDDDYARVVIAEGWAHAPRWDASGTSWLPFPFWVVGAVMGAAGTSLTTARATALVLGAAAALLVYVAARWIGEARAPALAGGLVAVVFPWSAWLGAATVPELPTAALALVAMAALVPVGEDARTDMEVGLRRLVGGAALFAATLSRYETWPVAAMFAAFCVVDTRRWPEARARLLGAGALALAGPMLWVAWNRIAHHDALHFLARVAAYRQALGGVEASAASRAVAYPIAFVREAPELAVVVVLGAAFLAGRGMRALGERMRPYARPAWVVVAQVAALSVAMIKDGAPTHHPERAVLSAMLLAAVLGGALVTHALAPMPAVKRALAAAGIAALAVAAGALGHGARDEAFVQRCDEEAIGRAARTQVPPGTRLLVEAVDYGHLAVEAAFGRPWEAEADRSLDPRQPKTASSFEDSAALATRLSIAGARCAASRVTNAITAAMGSPLATAGSWGLFCNETPR